MRLYDYSASGNCYKVRLLLALTGTPCERAAVDIFAGDTLTEAYGRLNPLRETPVLELDDGTCIAQSNAILWYLAEGTPFLPADRPGRALVAQWLAFEQERVMAGVGSARFRTLTGREAADPARVAAQRATGRNALELLDAHLGSRPFLVGATPTIADLSIFAYAARAPEAGIEVDDLPAFVAWTERFRALPRFMDDLEPYPANAAAGAGRSIYG